MFQCRNCNSNRITCGRLSTGDRAHAIFRPSKLRSFTVSIEGGIRVRNEAYACLDCGCIWSVTLPEALHQFVEKLCPDSVFAPEPPCPECKCNRVIVGRIVNTRRLSTFEPENMRFGLVRFLIGGIWLRDKAFACTNCGFVWTLLPAERLRQFIQSYCN